MPHERVKALVGLATGPFSVGGRGGVPYIYGVWGSAGGYWVSNVPLLGVGRSWGQRCRVQGMGIKKSG